jgi:hypothetical protein
MLLVSAWVHCTLTVAVQRGERAEFTSSSTVARSLSLLSPVLTTLFLQRERECAAVSLSLERECRVGALTVQQGERAEFVVINRCSISPFLSSHCSTEMRESRVCAVTLNRRSLFLSLYLLYCVYYPFAERECAGALCTQCSTKRRESRVHVVINRRLLSLSSLSGTNYSISRQRERVRGALIVVQQGERAEFAASLTVALSL